MSNKDKLDAVAFVGMFAVFLTVMYFFWTKPYNEFLNQTVECMNEMSDHSEEGYNKCAQIVRNTHVSE